MPTGGSVWPTGESLSARRAWIEIYEEAQKKVCGQVALRKESVDRNIKEDVSYNIKEVALRKESVDRNRNVFFRHEV